MPALKRETGQHIPLGWPGDAWIAKERQKKVEKGNNGSETEYNVLKLYLCPEPGVEVLEVLA